VVQARLHHLLTFDTVPAQLAYFEAELNQPGFRTRFIDYFDAANLSRGRDPRLYSYAAAAGGATFFGRLRRHLGRHLARDNFFFRFLFFGPQNLPEAILPPCYQAAHHGQLRARLGRLHLVAGEATEYLLSEVGQDVTKASLSNIFEYVSPAEFGRVSRALGQRAQPLRAVFWNLLQAQALRRTATVPLLAAASEALGAADGCFYFGGVRLLEYAVCEYIKANNILCGRHTKRSEASLPLRLSNSTKR
jgi:S-adenosylmethionine-diacylglycerol 3-amino-3-carboxypropyl transferase